MDNTMNANERDFKGVWIPREIWLEREMPWNARLIFLEIHSFTSRDRECFFTNEYLAEFIGISARQVSKYIGLLIEKGWIEQVSFDGRRRFLKSLNEARFYADTNKSSTQGGSQVRARVEEKGDLSITKTDTNKSNKTFSSDVVNLVDVLFLLIRRNDEKAKEPNFDGWREEMDRLIRIDGRGVDEIGKVIEWSQRNDFWKSNILSAKKLRAKFATLKLQMERENGGSGKGVDKHYRFDINKYPTIKKESVDAGNV